MAINDHWPLLGIARRHGMRNFYKKKIESNIFFGTAAPNVSALTHKLRPTSLSTLEEQGSQELSLAISRYTCRFLSGTFPECSWTLKKKG